MKLSWVDVKREAILVLLISDNSFQANSSLVPWIHCPVGVRCIRHAPGKHVPIYLLKKKTILCSQRTSHDTN